MSPQSQTRMAPSNKHLASQPADFHCAALTIFELFLSHKGEWLFGVKYYRTQVTLVSRDILLWNMKSIKSLVRHWAPVIRISVAVQDNGVILEALPGANTAV